MKKEMRRWKQQMSEEEAIQALKMGTSGVLALIDEDGDPYGVPLSYVYDKEHIYFHCAKSGHKLEAIKQHHHRCCFTVIIQDEIVPEAYTTKYQSVMAFGTIHIMQAQEEFHNAIQQLAKRYAPDDQEEHRQRAIDQDVSHMYMLSLDIERISGKKARELVE